MYNTDDRKNTLICEFTVLEWRLICQLVHMYMVTDPNKKPLGKILAGSLREQTDLWKPDPEQHSVFPNPLTAPSEAITIPGVLLRPYDRFV